MPATKTNALKVPGANLYHEVRGSGPVLLLICGGVYDAAGYAPLAQQLADRYTVVTYDRRGNSRSPLDGPPEPQSIEVHGDDAHRLLSAVGVTAHQPASVFGNSSGGTIGLELATRHPEQVRTLVVHEPPLFELLPERDHWRTVIRNVEDTFRREGAGPAMQVLNAAFAMSGAEESERVAARLATPSDDATRSGLPLRRSRAHLVPGAFESGAEPTAPRRSPEELRQRMSGYRSGLRRPREEGVSGDAP